MIEKIFLPNANNEINNEEYVKRMISQKVELLVLFFHIDIRIYTYVMCFFIFPFSFFLDVNNVNNDVNNEK